MHVYVCACPFVMSVSVYVCMFRITGLFYEIVMWVFADLCVRVCKCLSACVLTRTGDLFNGIITCVFGRMSVCACVCVLTRTGDFFILNVCLSVYVHNNR